MSKLIFKAADVRRVVDHSINALEQSKIAKWETANEENGWTPDTAVPDEPHVILVHDQGVYLMSNGSPRDIVKGESSFCAYALGCHPEKNDDFWETGRHLVGGDDFGEYLPWAKEIKGMLDAGATEIIVNFSKTQLSVSAKYPRRRRAA